MTLGKSNVNNSYYYLNHHTYITQKSYKSNIGCVWIEFIVVENWKLKTL